MSEKICLGLSLGFNSTACVVSNERGLLSAISQERLNGLKNTKDLPIDAALECLKIANINKIHSVAISHYEKITDEYFMAHAQKEYVSYFESHGWEFALMQILSDNGIDVDSVKGIVRVDHHVAHRYSTFAFHGTPLPDDYSITSDGFGDGFSATINQHGSGVVSKIKLKNSIALVYQFVTGALGFKEHQHEGKITGLAAYGKPVYLSTFEELYYIGDDGLLNFKDEEYSLDAFETEQVAKSQIIDFDKFLKLKEAIYEMVYTLQDNYNAKREDIAASVQEFAEKYTLNWIKKYCQPGHDCYLSGGLFANVKINQRIKDSGLFNNVYVCPAMGDEGTAVGAAIYVSKWKSKKVDTLAKTRSGNRVEGDIAEFVLKYLEENNLKDKYEVDMYGSVGFLIDEIARLLSNNNIVCLVHGSMEFGPRALCHRSILYNCDTKETNDWLNKKLSRTEFMPFAPVCMREFADDLFENLDGGRDTAKLMTMTFDCKEEFVKDYPAACHIDNTARPQIVSHDDDPFMWNILAAYHMLTSKKALINTSFNLHNWPIIATKEVALESWITSDTDCLVIENVLIRKK